MDSMGRTRYQAAKRSWIALFMIAASVQAEDGDLVAGAVISPSSQIAPAVIPPDPVTRLLPAGWR